MTHAPPRKGPRHERAPQKSVRWAGYFALAAGLVYCATTAAGSLLDRSYSQLAQPVSDLTATGAATRGALLLPYVFYNVLCFAFALALYQASTRDRRFKIGLCSLTINALAGIMMVTWFPEDKGGALVTSAGTGHVVFAGVSSPAREVSAQVLRDDANRAPCRTGRLRPNLDLPRIRNNWCFTNQGHGTRHDCCTGGKR